MELSIYWALKMLSKQGITAKLHSLEVEPAMKSHQVINLYFTIIYSKEIIAKSISF